MRTYCVSCKKTTASENSSVKKNTQNRLLLYQIVLFVARKNQLSLKIKKIRNFHKISNDFFKMNKIINKLLLTGDKFMSEFH